MVIYHSYVVHMIRIHSLFSHRKELIGPINQSWNMRPISNPYEKICHASGLQQIKRSQKTAATPTPAVGRMLAPHSARHGLLE